MDSGGLVRISGQLQKVEWQFERKHTVILQRYYRGLVGELQVQH